MCGRFYVEADDPEIIAIVNAIGGGTKISVGEVFPTKYCGRNRSERRGSRHALGLSAL